MLKKAYRADRKAFKSSDRPLKVVTGDYFSLRVFKITLEKPKFAVSISKKQEKKAVLRNKIRRLAYSSLSHILDTVPNGFLLHFVLIQKPKDLKHDINKDIQTLITKIA